MMIRRLGTSGTYLPSLASRASDYSRRALSEWAVIYNSCKLDFPSLPDIVHRRRRRLTDHYSVCRRLLLTCVGSKSVHLSACSSTRKGSELSCTAPNGSKHLRKAFGRNVNIAGGGSQARCRDNPECCTRSIFCFRPGNLVVRRIQ